MDAPKVSVIVPVYNTEAYLEQCMESITKQTLREIEIILVDDGSKKACAELCDALAKTDTRIKVIHKENQGLGMARNSGMKVACGTYIGFVDSDDYIDLSMYESLYNAAAAHDADITVSGISFVGGNTFGKSGEYEEKHYFEKETVFENEEMKTFLLGVVGALPHEPDDSRYGVSVCKNIFKRALIQEKKIEFFSERQIISEDTLFMVDYIKHATKAVGIPGAFYRYRRNDASLSKSYKRDRFDKVLVFLAELEAHLKEIMAPEVYKLYLDRLIQGYGRIVCSQEIVYALEQKMKYAQLRERLAKICLSEMLTNALKTYPWHRLPKKQAAFAFAMKYKLYYLQKIMVALRAR